MSKLLGYFDLDLGLQDLDRVIKLSETSRSRNELPCQHIQSAQLVAAFTVHIHMNLHTGFAQDNSSGLTVLLLGRVDNRKEFTQDNLKSNSEILLNKYLDNPKNALQSLKGDFSGFIFNSKNNELILFRDKIGVAPLYYSIEKSRLIFASEIKSILALSDLEPKAEPQGLSDYIDGGDLSIRDDLTCFKNIYSVLPAHLVKIKNFNSAIEQYWDFNLEANNNQITFEDAKTEFKKLFKQAVERRIHYAKNPSVSLSGGLDSSAIYGQAQDINSDTKAYSYVSNLVASDEKKYLNDIENKFKKNITRVPIDDYVNISSTVADQIQIVEAPFVDYLWSITSQFEQFLANDKCEIMMSGHWGDQIFFDWGYLIDDIKEFKFKRVFSHLKEYNNWYQENVGAFIKNQIFREMIKMILPQPLIRLYKHIKAEMLRHKSKWLELRAIIQDNHVEYAILPKFNSVNLLKVSHQTQSLYNQVRSRYHIHCLEWNFKVANYHGIEFSFPILDIDLLQFMLTLPGHLQNHKGVPRAILRESLRDLLPQTIADRTWKADFSDFVHDAIRKEVSQIAKGLNANASCVQNGILSKDSLKNMTDHAKISANENDNTVSWRLFDLLGLETWSSTFLDKNDNIKADTNYTTGELSNEIAEKNSKTKQVTI